MLVHSFVFFFSGLLSEQQVQLMTDGFIDSRLICDSPALYKVLYKDEKNVAWMLLALRGMGEMLDGFYAGLCAERPGILLIYGELENQ